MNNKTTSIFQRKDLVAFYKSVKSIFMNNNDVLNIINPDKIYVENVRSILKVPRAIAKLVCEMAVVDKLFTKEIGLVCPNKDCKRIVKVFHSKKDIPEFITCDICDCEDEHESTFETSKMKEIQFYRLNRTRNG